MPRGAERLAAVEAQAVINRPRAHLVHRDGSIVGVTRAVELRVVEGGREAPTVAPDPTPPAQVAADEVGSWIERARARDARAWSWLYRHHYDGLYRYVLYLQGDPATAEDLTQEAFVRALGGIGGYRAQASFATWLHRIALNVVRRHWRRTTLRERTVERFSHVTVGGTAGSPEDQHADARRARALLAALDRLPPKLREAFVLRDLMGMPSGEAAELIGISPGHLAVRGHRARAKLREALTAQGWTNDAGAPP